MKKIMKNWVIANYPEITGYMHEWEQAGFPDEYVFEDQETNEKDYLKTHEWGIEIKFSPDAETAYSVLKIIKKGEEFISHEIK